MNRPGQQALDLAHRPALGMEDFLVADSNGEAVAWIDRWPAWPGPALVLYGPPACGKTHLAHVWQALSGAVFVDHRALAETEPPALLGAALCAVVEDVDLGLTRAAERGLLHLYNILGEGGGHLLVTAGRPPSRWDLAIPDLASRLGAALTIAVGPPDDALLGAVLVKLFADRQLRVGEDVVAAMLARMERSFEGARRAVAELDRTALARRRKITAALVREMLEGPLS